MTTTTTEHGRLTLTFMETCYQSCCFGHYEPTHIVMSIARREELRGLVAQTHYPRPEWLVANGPLAFNRAIILGLPQFPDGYIWCANEERTHEGMNQRFEVS